MNEDAVVVEIDIAAPPERVFRALTDAKQLAQWWSDEGACVTEAWVFDLVGRTWRASGVDATGSWETWGEIVEFDPPRILAYTWNERLAKPRPLGATIVRYTLEATASGTRLRLAHSGFSGYPAARKSYGEGWPGVTAMLGAYLKPAESA